jgi:acyl-CoA synthetase (AMP-forming)/AMP-acid ligase II
VCAAVATANPDRDCIVFGDRRLTFAQTHERAPGTRGAGRTRVGTEPPGAVHDERQEFLEGMPRRVQGARRAVNVNYRYVADELVYLLGNAGADAVIYHARFGPTLAEALTQLPPMALIHVDDDSGHEPLPGAVRYDELLASTPDDPLDLAPSPDDLYVLYTGGTTGMPKGVLWRQHDIYVNPIGGRTFGTDDAVASVDDIVERSRAGGPGSMSVAPLMHGAAQWAAFHCLTSGRPFVMPATTDHFDAAERWRWPAGNASGRWRPVRRWVRSPAAGTPGRRGSPPIPVPWW